jgi:hypothetical protein
MNSHEADMTNSHQSSAKLVLLELYLSLSGPAPLRATKLQFMPLPSLQPIRPDQAAGQTERCDSQWHSYIYTCKWQIGLRRIAVKSCKESKLSTTVWVPYNGTMPRQLELPIVAPRALPQVRSSP